MSLFSKYDLYVGKCSFCQLHKIFGIKKIILMKSNEWFYIPRNGAVVSNLKLLGYTFSPERFVLYFSKFIIVLYFILKFHLIWS